MHRLIVRSLAYYWRTNLAVVLGVGTAVSVLAGALLVGDSVRASLRNLVLQRLGNTDHVIRAPRFFREALAGDLEAQPGFRSAFASSCPLIVLEGTVTHEESGRRGSSINVYGVDERFWSFHGRGTAGRIEGREALLSEALAAELQSPPGSTLLVTVEQPSEISGASLYGRRESRGRTLRLRTRSALAASDLGEFSLRPHQQAVRAVFVPLRFLQRTLDQRERVNTLLVAEAPASAGGEAGPGALADLLAGALSLEDMGLRLRLLEARGVLSLESEDALVDDDLAAATRHVADRLGLATEPILTYLANSIRLGDRTIPYSLIAALGPDAYGTLAGGTETSASSMLLNEWAAQDLEARPGDRLSIDYYVWEEGGRLSTHGAEFEVVGVVPLEGAAADPDLTPEYPGITESESLSDWDPPFPIDLGLVRPRDEDYWDRYRTTPKAFVPLADGQGLWAHRLGRLTSIRLRPGSGDDLEAARAAFSAELTAALNPATRGFSVEAVRATGLRASMGATDFSEYFVYFSFFLVVSALLLAGLFFRLGVEQRIQQLGLLRALGFSGRRLRSLFLGEGLVLALLGSLLGIAGAVAYGGLMVLGLRTLWLDAVGTERLSLDVSVASLLIGAVGGVAAGLLTIVWTLWSLRRISPRGLLAGALEEAAPQAARPRRAPVLAASAFGASLLLLVAAAVGVLGEVPGFFGSGALLLVAALTQQWVVLSARARRGSDGPQRLGLAWLGFRNASHRPGRSVLSIALIAFATFVIVSVGAFRREGDHVSRDRRSGTGGYTLAAHSLLPLYHDPSTPAGLEALNLGGEAGPTLEGVRFARFRLRPGEDASCLNLYRPGSPAILAPTDDFLREGRFVFAGSLAATPEETENPWLLLEREGPEGSVPVIGDVNSMTYVLHRKLGEQLVFERPGSSPLRLWFVAALRDSVFQGQLLMAGKHFLRSFPEQEGFRFLLLETPDERAPEVAALLESRLADLGLDVQPTADLLAGFHRVENTYLSTFQTLGGLGLLLGTIGLATVLMRNALERRRELALLRAVGYRRRHLSWVLMAENGLLLVLGLATGTLTALLAIAPALASRGSPLPAREILLLLLGVLLLGLLISRLAVAVIHRLPLLATLRSE